MAAITTTLFLLKSGDHVIVTDNVYGGTYRLFTQVFCDLGLEFTFVDTSDLDETRRAMKPNTRMLYSKPDKSDAFLDRPPVFRGVLQGNEPDDGLWTIRS